MSPWKPFAFLSDNSRTGSPHSSSSSNNFDLLCDCRGPDLKTSRSYAPNLTLIRETRHVS
jgi:hypothetical protein